MFTISIEEHEPVKKPVPSDFRIWKSLKLGGIQKPTEAKRLLHEADVDVDKKTDQLLDGATFEGKEYNVKLVRTSVKELGLRRATTEELYTKAHDLGLSLCPHEVAVQLWLQYPDLLNEEGLLITVAIDPIKDDDELFATFFLGYLGEPHRRRFLNKVNIFSDYPWHCSSNGGYWLFVKS